MSRPSQRWLASGTETLRGLLERAGSELALVEGRVFIDGKRADDAELLPPSGAAVEIFEPRSLALNPCILRVEGGLAFVEKPPGIATEPDQRGASTSLLHWAAAELGVAPDEINALSRLDVGVSGVVVLGLDAEARKRVQSFRERGLWKRRYVALAAGIPEPELGTWDDPIQKGRGSLRVTHPSGEKALTRYRVVAKVSSRIRGSVLSLDPETGRTHQLRVHAAAHGAPLFGDRSYGGPTRVASSTGAVRALGRVLLHAAWVDLPGQTRVVSALPPEFAVIWASLGGNADALETATDLPSPLPI